MNIHDATELAFKNGYEKGKRDAVLKLAEFENVFRSIIDRYGVPSRVDLTIEECSELTKALLKMRRSETDSNVLRADIIEEIADVSIMLEQLKIIFDCEKEVSKEIEYKLNRQIKRMETEI
jgi:hypothetical protein